jgi:hypothetical protein
VFASLHHSPKGTRKLTDPAATFYDAEGKEVNLADMDDDDEDLEKRVPKWKLAIKFAKLVAKYGKRAWTYIYCVGTAPFWKCGDEVSYSCSGRKKVADEIL